MIELGSAEYRKISWGLALGAFLIFCNLYLFQPILPHMAKLYHVSSTQVNWLFAASTLALSLTLVPWAIASESYGRRNIMMIGLLTLPVAGALLLFYPTWWTLIAERTITGFAIAAFASVAVAYMVEELSSQAFHAAIGAYISANSLGGISGRIIGGSLTGIFNWEVAVMTMCIITVLGTICVWFLLPAQKNFTPRPRQLIQHQLSVLSHLRNRELWFAMLIGGANFALFVNLYSVMGFRLVAPPYNLPIALVALIFICYLGGTLSSRLTSRWLKYYHPISGMVAGTLISLVGMWLALAESVICIVLALVLISFGAFFTHTLAYSWVSRKAQHAKATATALYLVHYYIGGSLGGFFLLYCWQHAAWHGVVFGGSLIYVILFALCRQLKTYETPRDHISAGSGSLATKPTSEGQPDHCHK
jgi:predicted MFS family arabinose efflux permease